MEEDALAEAPWVRPLVVIAAAAVFLVSGVAGGLLLGRLLPGPVQTAPGPIAVGFVQDMIVHHRQAVQIAGWVGDHGADPDVRLLACAIELSSASELGRMQGWLEAWGQPEAPANGPMTWMEVALDDPHGHAGREAQVQEVAESDSRPQTMPGLASEDDLRRLYSSSGSELDVFFLQLMLRHHEGGEPMLEYATQLAELPAVRALGISRLDEQAAEGTRLREMLAARDAAPLDG